MFISVWTSRILKRQQFDLKIYVILLLLYYKRAVEGQSHNLISWGTNTNTLGPKRLDVEEENGQKRTRCDVE